VNRLLLTASRMFRRTTRRLKFEAVGLTIPPFTASFTIRHRRKRAAAIRFPKTPAPVESSVPFRVVLDTVETITDTERKRAIKRRDWVTAIGAAYIQDCIRQTRRKG